MPACKCAVGSFATSALLVAVATAVLLTHSMLNPGQAAQNHFKRHNRPLYYMMQLSYAVIIAALVFNLRVVIRQTWSAAMRSRH